MFLFIGGGHLRGPLEAEARARGLANVSCRPYQPRDRLGESLAVADVHWVSLLPLLEGLIVPSKVYGVLAAGRPTLMIGDPEGEIGRLLRRYQCGVTIAVGAGPEFASAVLRLRDDPATRHDMGRRARAAFEEQFGPEQAFDAWKKLLGRLHATPLDQARR